MEGSIKIFNEGRRPVGTLVLLHPSLCGMENHIFAAETAATG